MNEQSMITTNDSSAVIGFNPNVILTQEEIEKAKVWLTSILGQKSGVTSIQDGMAVLMKAKDYNVPFSSAIEHFHIINGKTGADIHILKALLSRAGTTWQCTKDYVPLYEYTDGTNVYSEQSLPSYCVICKNAEEADKATDVDKGTVGVYPLKYYIDAKGNRFNEFELSDKWTICSNKFHLAKVQKDGGYGVIRVPAKPIDYICEFEFTRRRVILGEKVVTTCKSSYSYSEAVQADMFTKDTYKKYPKVMIKARAWTYGARDIASDVCLGLMETTELKHTEDIPLSATDVEFAEI